MNKENPNYRAYIRILEEELVPAMGCTEPIALAYCAAKAREVLGEMPDRVAIGASGSIIKNVKSVIVPNTNHMKGIPAAAVAGIVGGDASRELEVIADVSPEKIAQMRTYLESTPITVEHSDNGLPFEIAASACRAAKLPACTISGQRLTENSPLLRAWLLDCGYRGMLWGDETLANDRIGLEKAAIRILKLVLQLKKG